MPTMIARRIQSMTTITLPWETWRAVIAVLRAKGLPSMLEHANFIEQQLERHARDLVARLVGSRRLVAVSSLLAQLSGAFPTRSV